MEASPTIPKLLQVDFQESRETHAEGNVPLSSLRCGTLQSCQMPIEKGLFGF